MGDNLGKTFDTNGTIVYKRFLRRKINNIGGSDVQSRRVGMADKTTMVIQK